MPAVIQLTQNQSYGHQQHLSAFQGLTNQDADPATLLHLAIEHSRVVGMADSQTALLKTPDQVGLAQLLALKDQTPLQVLSLFPFVSSPHRYWANTDRVLEHHNGQEALVELELDSQTKCFAFAHDYCLSKSLWQHKRVQVELSGLAHDVALSNPHESLSLSDNPKDTKAFFEQLKASMHAQSEVLLPKLEQLEQNGLNIPMQINIGQLCAYLYSPITGQQDEAWCRGKLIGKQTVTILLETFELLDVVVLNEENTQPVVVRLAAHQNLTPKSLKVGDYLTANVWLQAKVCATSV